MKVRTFRESWPIGGAFNFARGSRTHAEVVVVELEHKGHIGQGECVPSAHGGETVEGVMAQIRAMIPALAKGLKPGTLQKRLPAGAARNALDCALWDLSCKRAGQRIWQRLDLPEPGPLLTAYTLSLDSAEQMEAAARKQAHRPLLKLQLDGNGDLERVTGVRRAAPGARLIVDANGSWNESRYLALVPELQKLGVEMIEQPLPAGADASLAWLPRPIPVCADQSCHDRQSLPGLVGRYDMINIKTDKAGGLTEALALKQHAEAQGLRIMVGSKLATSLGMAPAFLLAQGAELVDLDGPLLLAQDRQPGFAFEQSHMLPCDPRLWG